MPGPAADILALFGLDQAWSGLDAFTSSLGTPTSGPLGSLVLAFFTTSLVWNWVKNRFDTWSLWDTFLRLFIVVAGITMWTTAFQSLDHALVWLAEGGGAFNSAQDFYDVAYAPFDQVVIAGISLVGFSWVNPLTFIVAVIPSLLICLIVAAYVITVIMQELLVMFCYAVGPIFLACYLFDPLSDLWMRWIRTYLTARTWTLVINVFLFIFASAVRGANLNSTFAGAANLTLPITYMIILLAVIASSFPVARGLIGGYVSPAITGAIVPSVASAAATGALVVAGMAVGSAGGPAGASAGGAAGGGAGKVASSAAPTREG